MAFENIKAEIAMLMADLEHQHVPPDRHELYLEIMQKLNELKAYGMPLPDDLVELEHRLEREFAAEQRDQRAADGDPGQAPERHNKR